VRCGRAPNRTLDNGAGHVGCNENGSCEVCSREFCATEARAMTSYDSVCQVPEELS
jgi:hypothetical protein